MKVLHIIQRYRPAPLTGSEKAMVILCEALKRDSSDDIQVLTSDVELGEGFYDPRIKRFAQKRETINGVTVIRLPVNWLKASIFYILKNFLSLPSDRLAFESFGPQLVNVESSILREAPDLLHVAPMPMSHVYATWKVTMKHRLPLVITPTMHFEDQRFDNALLYKILADATAIIAHTEYEKRMLVARGIQAAKIEVIPSSYLTKKDFTAGRDQAFRQKHDLGLDPVVLFLGSKSFDKGTVHLLEAWPKVKETIPNARLVIAGVPTSSWVLGKKDKDMSNVIELDYIDEETKHDVLRVCNILCVPSKAESFGMILLEAWAKEKPVIGGSAGATREMISEDKDGYAVEFGDVDTLATRIIMLLRDPKKQKELGTAGKEKAKGFNESEIVRKTLEVYRKALK